MRIRIKRDTKILIIFLASAYLLTGLAILLFR